MTHGSSIISPHALLGRYLVLFAQDDVVIWEAELDVLEVSAGLGHRL